MRIIILCADDFGQNAEISQGIIELIRQQRLSATSCMVTEDDFQNFAPQLLVWQAQCDIGLHFNLTHGTALSDSNWQFSSLNNLIKQAVLGRINYHIIQKELSAQIQKFTDVMQKQPDFIDGHQHIHQLPIIRNVLVDTIAKMLNRPYVRVTANRWWEVLCDTSNFPKAQVIHLLGALRLKKLCLENNIPINSHFAGIYRFNRAKDYAKIFPKFLHKINNLTLIMCHPGLASTDSTDLIRNARIFEYQYLMSEQFLQDCRRYAVKIGRIENI